MNLETFGSPERDRWDDDPVLDQQFDRESHGAESDDEFDQPVPLLRGLGQGYNGQDPDILKEIKAIVQRTKITLNDTERQAVEAQLRARKEQLIQADAHGYPSAPDIIELAWVVAARAIYEACFHPEIHCSRYGHYMNLAALIGGLGEEPRLCLNILRADAWRQVQRNEIYLKGASKEKREQYQLRVWQRSYRTLEFMYWEAGLPIALETAQAQVKFDWQSPQFAAIREDKYSVLLDLNHQSRAFDLFATIEAQSTKLRQERPHPKDPSQPAWSACQPEYADRSFSSHTQALIERQKQRTIAQSRYEWDDF